MKLFFDTETSDKADFKLPPEHPSQPRLLQLAVILTDDDCKEISHAKILVKPDGWQISPNATAVHGITTEYAIAHGVNVACALSVFHHCATASALTVAFNHQFDDLIMSAEFARFPKWQNPLRVRPSLCEMLAMTPICKLPQRNFRGGITNGRILPKRIHAQRTAAHSRRRTTHWPMFAHLSESTIGARNN